MSELKEAIERMIKPLLQKQVVVGKVKSVDMSALTCDVTVIGSYTREGVRLKAVEDSVLKGFILKPKVGSDVTIRMVENDRNMWELSAVSEVDGIYLKGDQWSLVKAETLKQVMDVNKQFIDAFKQVLATPIPEPGNGANSAFQAALNGVLSSLNWGDHSNIDNTNVKHG
ncbi:MAG: hypothetical protein AB7G44_04970 [Bacteroidia bacterium]